MSTIEDVFVYFYQLQQQLHLARQEIARLQARIKELESKES